MKKNCRAVPSFPVFLQKQVCVSWNSIPWIMVFKSQYSILYTPETEPPEGTPVRGTYAAIAYKVPRGWNQLTPEQQGQKLVEMRLELRKMGEEDGDIMVFSFWPDTIIVKEVGDPLEIGEWLQLGANRNLYARAHSGTGQTEYQLRHQPLRLPPILYRRRRFHD